MRKPKCIECSSSTKRIYQRVGSKGTPTAIKHWWFCANCNKMQFEGYKIPEDESVYLHPDAAAKFPKIARLVENNHYLLSVSDELNTSVRSISNMYHWEREEAWKKIRGNWKNSFSLNLLKKKKPRAFWICEICLNKELIPKHVLMPLEDNIEPNSPIHCDQQMKIGLMTDEEYFDDQMEKSIEKIISQVVSNNLEDAGKLFLDLILDLLLQYGSFSMQSKLIKLKKLKEIEDLQFMDTWGYKTVNCIFDTFKLSFDDRLNLEIELPTSIISFLFKITSIRPDKQTSIYLNRIFNDIILYYFKESPKMIPQYRIKFSKIEKIFQFYAEKFELWRLASEYDLSFDIKTEFEGLDQKKKAAIAIK